MKTEMNEISKNAENTEKKKKRYNLDFFDISIAVAYISMGFFVIGIFSWVITTGFECVLPNPNIAKFHEWQIINVWIGLIGIFLFLLAGILFFLSWIIEKIAKNKMK